MSSTEHSFTLDASWSGGLAGGGHVRSGALDTDVSSPTAFGGPGKGSNPEELLLGAAASCYLITFAAICQRRELPIEAISMTSSARTTLPPQLKLLEIVHRPVITLGVLPDEKMKADVLDAALKAETFCMVSSALRGNVPIRIEATIS